MKSNYLNIVLVGLITLALVSCDNSGRQNDNEEKASVEATESAEVVDVLTAYIQMKDAFVATDYEAVKSTAASYNSVIKGNVEASYEQALLNLTNQIAEAGDIEAQRQIFEQVSTIMYALAENGQFEGQKLYKQFCPMAFDNKGAFWLSMDEGILNPYFGDKMLKCGYVEKVL
jgi:hypothetical protein